MWKPPVKCRVWIITFVSPWARNIGGQRGSDCWRSSSCHTLVHLSGSEERRSLGMRAPYRWPVPSGPRAKTIFHTVKTNPVPSWTLRSIQNLWRTRTKRSWLPASQGIWRRVRRLWLPGAKHRLPRRSRWARPHDPRLNQPTGSFRKSGTCRQESA